MSSAWFFYALGAALFWATAYVIAEKLLLAGLRPAFIIFLDALLAIPFYFFLATKFGEVEDGFRILFTQRDVLLLAVISGLTLIGGNFLVILSVDAKNATLASLVESAYPVFTFLIAWAILKEVQITWETAVGGLMVLCGTSIIALKG